MTGYVRQSTAEIAAGEVVLAEPVNREFNRLQAFASGTTGHGHTGATGDGPPIDLDDGTTGVLPANRGGTGVTSAAANDMPYFTSSTAGAVTPTTSYGRGLLNSASAAALKASLDLEIGVDVQAWDTGLDALAAFNTNGLIVQTANNTYAGRTITGTANQVTVTNGDGVSGNPTLSLPSAVTLPGTLTVTGLTTFNDVNFETPVTITDGGSPTVITGDGNVFVLTAAGDRTITSSGTPSNGQKFVIAVKASTLDRTIDFDTGTFSIGGLGWGPVTSGTTTLFAGIYLTLVGKICITAALSNYS